MNDRFKFRIWNKRRKQYIFNGCLDIRYGCFSTQNLLDAKYFEIEQCTGLKDKNGKLIYEGDIVKIDGDKAVIHWSTLSTRYKIVSVEDIFDFDTSYAEDCEVIGNVHENKELLDD